jgi:type IV secretion system protein VirB1
VLTENYNAVSDGRTQTDAIEATWSLYNSGSPSRGMRNGYVRKVWSAAATLVPQMKAMLNGDQTPVLAAADAPAPVGAPSDSSTVPAPGPRWIYGTPNTGVIVFK